MSFAKKKHRPAKKKMRLEMAGYFAKKGEFGFLYKGTKSYKIQSK